jgi:hypothetical protein
LRGQKKRTKEKAARQSLDPALLAFDGGRPKGLLPLGRRDSSLNRPCGLIPSKAPVLGATERGLKSKSEEQKSKSPAGEMLLLLILNPLQPR